MLRKLLKKYFVCLLFGHRNKEIYLVDEYYMTKYFFCNRCHSKQEVRDE